MRPPLSYWRIRLYPMSISVLKRQDHTSKNTTATSFLDFLALGFHHQQDDSQLEDFIRGEAHDISGDEAHVHFQDIVLATASTEVLFLDRSASEQSFKPTQWRAQKHFPFLSHRGPPSQLS